MRLPDHVKGEPCCAIVMGLLILGICLVGGILLWGG